MLVNARCVAAAAAKSITVVWGRWAFAANAQLDSSEAVAQIGLAVIGRLVQVNELVPVRVQQLAELLVCALQLLAKVLVLEVLVCVQVRVKSPLVWVGLFGGGLRNRLARITQFHVPQ